MPSRLNSLSLRIRLLLAVALASLAMYCPPPAHAETIIGNLPQTNDNDTGYVRNTLWRAVSFTMKPDSCYTVDTVELRLSYWAGAMPIVELRSDNGGNPGAAVVAGFNNPTFGPGAQTYTFLPTTSVSLAANTTYWLVARGADSNNFGWQGSWPSILPTGVPATFGSHKYSVNNGGTWSVFGSRPSFRVNGTACAPGYGSTPAPGGALDITTTPGTNATATLSVSETGTLQLDVTGITITGADAGKFSVAPSNFSIADGGAAQDVTVTCDAANAGTFNATLEVAHNGANVASPATCNLTCTVSATPVPPTPTATPTAAPTAAPTPDQVGGVVHDVSDE